MNELPKKFPLDQKMSLDPFIEITFQEDPPSVLRERYQLPLFFILGGVDDDYLSQLMGLSIAELHQLVQKYSVDPFPPEDMTGGMSGDMIGVFASRALLRQNLDESDNTDELVWVRTFPVSTFLNSAWPILRQVYDPQSIDVSVPTEIERTWIVRAFRRNHQDELAEIIRTDMLRRIYPEKISTFVNSSLSQELSQDQIAQLEAQLTRVQRQYPAVIIVDDLPIKLAQTIGEIFTSISLTGCTTADQLTIQTSIDLLKLV